MKNKLRTRSIIVIPHWRIEGGAGFYIRDLIKALAPHAQVRVAGRHAADYDASPILSAFLDKLGASSLPAYEGIRPVVTLFHFFMSLGRILQLWAAPKNKRFEERPSVFIFTSSVQALSVPVTRWFFPDSRIVIAVQEQVDLSRVFGKPIAWLFRRSDVVLAITGDWAAHARKFGVDSFVVHNQYDPAYAAPELNQDPMIESDILYVGGGARIKGFNEFTAALQQLLEPLGRRVLCLGNYDQSALNALKRIGACANTGSSLDIVGHVPDIRPYLRGTKLLLLPIGSPHFCRPAIEAGFFGKTFVIPDFSGLTDFVRDGENCQTYAAGDASDLVVKVDGLLGDDVRRAALEAGNREMAQRFTRKSNDYEIVIGN